MWPRGRSAPGHLEQLPGLGGDEAVEPAVALGDLQVGVGPFPLALLQPDPPRRRARGRLAQPRARLALDLFLHRDSGCLHPALPLLDVVHAGREVVHFASEQQQPGCVLRLALQLQELVFADADGRWRERVDAGELAGWRKLLQDAARTGREVLCPKLRDEHPRLAGLGQVDGVEVRVGKVVGVPLLPAVPLEESGDGGDTAPPLERSERDVIVPEVAAGKLDERPRIGNVLRVPLPELIEQVHAGRRYHSPGVIVTSTSDAPRRTLPGMGRPIEDAPSSRCTSSTVFTGDPSRLSRMSPERSPAWAAGLSGTTSSSSTPVFCATPRWRAIRRSSGRVWAASPSTPRRTRPCCISSPSTQRAVSTGTEKLSPWAPRITAVLIPTTRAWLSTRGPPLLPGFSATSLWTMASINRPSCAHRVRPRALTTPALTV